jgi:hypothetical protein
VTSVTFGVSMWTSLHVRYDETGDHEAGRRGRALGKRAFRLAVDPIMATTLRPVAVRRITSVDSLG